MVRLILALMLVLSFGLSATGCKKDDSPDLGSMANDAADSAEDIAGDVENAAE